MADTSLFFTIIPARAAPARTNKAELWAENAKGAFGEVFRPGKIFGKSFPKTIDKSERRAIIRVQKENNFHEMLFSNKEGRSDEQVSAEEANQPRCADGKIRRA